MDDAGRGGPLERTRSSVRRLRLRLGLADTTWLFVVAALVGLAAGLGSIGFHLLISLVQWCFFGSTDRSGPLSAVTGPNACSPLRVLLAPTIGGLIVGPLVHVFAKEARGHGVPALVKAVHERGGRMSPAIAAVKTLASAVTLGSGGALGREGPLVQIGGAIGSTIGQALDVAPRHLKMVVAGGAAGGLAAVFNAPLGGAFFALEVILGTFAVEAFGPVVVAAVAATVVSRAILGDHPVIAAPSYELGHAHELLAYLVLGIVCGGVAVALTRAVGVSTRLFDRVPLPEWSKATLGGLATGAIAVLVTPRVLGNGYETVDALIASRPVETSFLVVLGAKLFATSLGLASGGSGGLFGPSLFLGAVTGAVVRAAVAQVAPVAPSGAFALVGMAALVAGATHAPVSMGLMLFEMTDNYRIVLPLLLATSVSSAVAKRLYAESVDTVVDAVRGLPRHHGVEGTTLGAVSVDDFLRRTPDTQVAPGTGAAELVDRFLAARTDVLAVVHADGRFVGLVLLEDLTAVIRGEARDAAPSVVALDLVRQDAPRLAPGDPITRAIEAFHGLSYDALPVVDAATGAFVGLLDEKEIVTAYRTHVLTAELRASFAEADAPAENVDLPEGVGVGRVAVPAWLAGRSLAESDLRRRYGVLVLTIRDRDEAGTLRRRVPDPSEPLALGVQLVVLGPRSALDAWKRGEPPAPVSADLADAVLNTASQRRRREKGS